MGAPWPEALRRERHLGADGDFRRAGALATFNPSILQSFNGGTATVANAATQAQMLRPMPLTMPLAEGGSRRRPAASAGGPRPITRGASPQAGPMLTTQKQNGTADPALLGTMICAFAIGVVAV